jgi:hypothetical protein
MVAEVKPFVAILAASLTLVGCSGAPVEEGLFFPTWSAEGAVPGGRVQGTLVEDNQCLFVERHDQRALVAWEDGMGYEDGTLLDVSGSPLARVGEVIHGGGGYYGHNRHHIEQLSGETIPERCFPDSGRERLAIIYEVEAGSFE